MECNAKRGLAANWDRPTPCMKIPQTKETKGGSSYEFQMASHLDRCSELQVLISYQAVSHTPHCSPGD